MHVPSVSRSRSTFAAVATCAAFLCVGTVGCGSSAGTAGNAHLEKLNQDTEAFVVAGETLTTALVKVVGIATWDFSKTLPQGAPLATDPVLSREERVRFDDAVLATIAPAAATLLAALELVESATAEGNPVLVPSATDSSASGLERDGCVDGGLCYRQRAVVIESLLVMGGVGLVAWMGFGGASEAFDARNAPSVKVIEQAQGKELEAINGALGLPADTANAKALETFKALPFNDRQAAHRKIEDINADADIGSLSATSDINASVARAANIAGETGVRVYAKVPGMVGGGSTLGLLSKAKGWGEAGEAVDLALDVADQAMSSSKSGEPIADKATVVVVTKPNEMLATPAPTHSMTSADARTMLAEAASGKNLGTKTSEEVLSAGSIVAKDLAVKAGLADKVRTDGSVVATVPGQVYMTRLTKPKWGDKVQVPQMGPVNILFVADGKVPQVVPDVDATNGGKLKLADQDLATYDPQAKTPSGDVIGGDAAGTDAAEADATGRDPGTMDVASGETVWLMCRASQFGDGTGGDYYACTLYNGNKDPFSQAFQDEADAQCKSATYDQGLSSRFFVEADPEKACVDACKSMGAKLPVNRCDTPYTSAETTGTPCQGVAVGSDACWQNACYNCCGDCEKGYVKLFDCAGGCAVSGALCDCSD